MSSGRNQGVSLKESPPAGSAIGQRKYAATTYVSGVGDRMENPVNFTRGKSRKGEKGFRNQILSASKGWNIAEGG